MNVDLKQIDIKKALEDFDKDHVADTRPFIQVFTEWLTEDISIPRVNLYLTNHKSVK